MSCACSQRRYNANIVFDTLCFEILCCRCGRIFADEHEGSTSLSITQELNHQWFDRKTIPNNTLRQRARREVRHGLSQVQLDYCNANRVFLVGNKEEGRQRRRASQKAFTIVSSEMKHTVHRNRKNRMDRRYLSRNEQICTRRPSSRCYES